MFVHFCLDLRKIFYSEEENEISPPFKLGGKFIREKVWFHAIEYGSFNLANSVSSFVF